MNGEQASAPPDEEEQQVEEPEFFDRVLLLQPPEVRQESFEQRCLIEHPRLLEALDAILDAICAPGEEVLTRRPGTMVLLEKSSVEQTLKKPNAHRSGLPPKEQTYLFVSFA